MNVSHFPISINSKIGAINKLLRPVSDGVFYLLSLIDKLGTAEERHMNKLHMAKSEAENIFCDVAATLIYTPLHSTF